MGHEAQTNHAEQHPVVLFDGDCGLCDRWVQFVLRADRQARFRFAPLQPEDLAQADSVVLRERGRTYLRSEAVLRTLGGLGFPYSLATALRLVPVAWRDTFYNQVARHRYRLFGRRLACRIPTPAERARFVS